MIEVFDPYGLALRKLSGSNLYDPNLIEHDLRLFLQAVTALPSISDEACIRPLQIVLDAAQRKCSVGYALKLAMDLVWYAQTQIPSQVSEGVRGLLNAERERRLGDLGNSSADEVIEVLKGGTLDWAGDFKRDSKKRIAKEWIETGRLLNAETLLDAIVPRQDDTVAELYIRLAQALDQTPDEKGLASSNGYQIMDCVCKALKAFQLQPDHKVEQDLVQLWTRGADLHAVDSFGMAYPERLWEAARLSTLTTAATKKLLPVLLEEVKNLQDADAFSNRLALSRDHPFFQAELDQNDVDTLVSLSRCLVGSGGFISNLSATMAFFAAWKGNGNADALAQCRSLERLPLWGSTKKALLAVLLHYEQDPQERSSFASRLEDSVINVADDDFHFLPSDSPAGPYINAIKEKLDVERQAKAALPKPIPQPMSIEEFTTTFDL